MSSNTISPLRFDRGILDVAVRNAKPMSLHEQLKQ